MKVLDLFAGAGGWDVAAQELGFDVMGVENMKEAVATREANGLVTLFDDVWAPFADTGDGYLTRKAMFDWWDEKPIMENEPKMLIASPPCQTFSAAGKGAGRAALDDVLDAIRHYDNMFNMLVADYPLSYSVVTAAKALHDFTARRGMDERTALVITPLLYVDWLLPRYILLEQVPSVLPVWEAYRDELVKRGYSVAVGHVQAEQYGVPQTRRRAVLVARRDGGEARLPKPTHSKYHNRNPKVLDGHVLPWVSMGDALGFRNDSEVPVPAHLRSNYGTSGDKDNRGEHTIDQPAPTITSKANRNHWVFNRPSTTIVGSFRPDIVAAPGYRKAGDGPRQNQPGSVQVTLEQAAALQSFPAGFRFEGSVNKRFLQVGNAVPPLLAKHLLEAVTR